MSMFKPENGDFQKLAEQLVNQSETSRDLKQSTNNQQLLLTPEEQQKVQREALVANMVEQASALMGAMEQAAYNDNSSRKVHLKTFSKDELKQLSALNPDAIFERKNKIFAPNNATPDRPAASAGAGGSSAADGSTSISGSDRAPLSAAQTAHRLHQRSQTAAQTAHRLHQDTKANTTVFTPEESPSQNQEKKDPISPLSKIWGLVFSSGVTTAIITGVLELELKQWYWWAAVFCLVMLVFSRIFFPRYRIPGEENKRRQ